MSFRSVQSIQYDAEAFGIIRNSASSKTPHSWEVMRENVQNYIHGLNFKYRVNLRKKNVKKGIRSTITSSRFVVAVGGRPTSLDCEGGELAISSDDIFSLTDEPGKVLCVGASYISLECAGFLAGLGRDVTVAVRSILLRGFDRECADKIGPYMADNGVKYSFDAIFKTTE